MLDIRLYTVINNLLYTVYEVPPRLKIWLANCSVEALLMPELKEINKQSPRKEDSILSMPVWESSWVIWLVSITFLRCWSAKVNAAKTISPPSGMQKNNVEKPSCIFSRTLCKNSFSSENSKAEYFSMMRSTASLLVSVSLEHRLNVWRHVIYANLKVHLKQSLTALCFYSKTISRITQGVTEGPHSLYKQLEQNSFDCSGGGRGPRNRLD